MAQSRLEKVGTIFSRVTGLLRSGAMKHENRPMWYDLYEAFPPEQEPRYDRKPKDVTVRSIFYPEDVVRARFSSAFGSPGVTVLTDDGDDVEASVCQRFVDRYCQLQAVSASSSEDQLFNNTADSLRADGLHLQAIKRAGLKQTVSPPAGAVPSDGPQTVSSPVEAVPSELEDENTATTSILQLPNLRELFENPDNAKHSK